MFKSRGVVTHWLRSWTKAASWSTAALKATILTLIRTVHASLVAPGILNLPHIRNASVSNLNFDVLQPPSCLLFIITLIVTQLSSVPTPLWLRTDSSPLIWGDTLWATWLLMSATLVTLWEARPVGPAYRTGSGAVTLPSAAVTVSPEERRELSGYLSVIWFIFKVIFSHISIFVAE